MATGLPSNIYSGGAVVLNTQPLAAMYQQYAAHRQAKEDALDNYFRDLGKNITPAGMRSQDVPGLTQKTNAWQQFYQQNKPQILNPRLDNGKAYSEYMSRYQDQLAHIQQSKDALKTTDELNKTRLNPATSYILDDPTIIDQIHQHDLPIGDPNRKELNLATLTTPPKPWDIKDQENYQKYRTSGLKKDEIYGQTQFLPGFKTSTPVTSQYSDDNLRVIGERGKAMYDMDRSLQSETNKLMKQIERDPSRQQQLNSAYKKIYGRDIQSPRDLRAAQDILEESTKSLEYKPGEDKLGFETYMEGIKFRHQKELKQSENEWIPQYFEKRITQAREGEPTPLPDPNNPVNIKMAHEIPVDGLTAKAFERNGKTPDRLYITTDNKIWPFYFERYDDVDEKGKKTGSKSIYLDANGNPQADKEISKPMDLDQAFLSMGYKGETKKQLGKTMSAIENTKTEKHPLPAGKPRTVKQGGYIYTYNENTGKYE